MVRTSSSNYYKILSVVLLFMTPSIYQKTYAQCNGVATMTDARDSKVYNIIQIDGSTGPYCIGTSQCWMAENLNHGTRVNVGTNQSDNGTIEKYCYSDLEANCTTDGAFYQWAEMMNYGASDGTNGPGPQGICPAGWHLPTDNEFKCMEMNLGMSQAQADINGQRGTDEGTKLKQGGSSGFEGRMTGYRDPAGPSYILSGSVGVYWVATETGASFGQSRDISTSYTGVGKGGSWKTTGRSVRCIGDVAPIPLPVELLYFDVKWTNDLQETADITWQTISETNNSHFEIEKSADGIDFELLKTVDGQGNSNQVNDYKTVDDNPIKDGESYYRLKQVDVDGKYTYSNIQVLNLDPGLNAIRLYPNPSVDKISLLLSSSENTEVIASIKNILGQEVNRINSTVNQGLTTLQFDISKLETGNYIIVVATESGLYKIEKKFVKSDQ